MLPKSVLSLRLCVAGIIVMLAGCTISPQAREAKFLKRGQERLAEKDYSRALLEFRNAAHAMPKDAEPYYQSGLVYIALGDVRGAVTALRKAADLDPKHAGAQLKLASLMTTSEKKDVLEDAAKRLQDLITSNPTNTEALDELAVAELKLGKPEEADKLIDQALAKSPADLQSAILAVQRKRQQKDLSGAEAILKKAADSAPKSTEAALALGRFYMQINQPGQAETQLRRTLALDANYAPALYSLGLIQMSENHRSEAEETFHKLGSLSDPKYQDYRAAYGVFLFQIGKTEAALTEFQKLAKEHPGNREMRDRLIAAYQQLGKSSEAEKLLTDALKHNPKDVDALLQRSELSLRKGDSTAAEKDLNEVLRFQPESAAAHFELSKVKRAQGLARTERQELTLALLRDPRYLAARIALTGNFLAANETKSALDLLDETPPSQKNSRAILTERNWALLAAGKFKEARAGIDQGLQGARTPDLLAQDGFLRQKERDFAGARNAAEELLKQNPEEPRGLRLLIDSYKAQKQLPKAVESIRGLAAQHPKSARLQFALGQVLLEATDRSAKNAFEAAEAADPKFSQAKLMLTQIDIVENHLDSARRRVAAVIASEPRNIGALLLAGDIEVNAGARHAAIANYRSVLDVDGSNALALNNLAYLVAEDNPDEGLKLAQKAGELAPDDPEVQDTLGWIYYRKGIYLTAINYLKTAVAKQPSARHQYHLAMCYLKAGNKDLGQRTLQAALSQDPSLAKEKDWN